MVSSMQLEIQKFLQTYSNGLLNTIYKEKLIDPFDITFVNNQKINKTLKHYDKKI
jgi:hypothetical protein